MKLEPLKLTLGCVETSIVRVSEDILVNLAEKQNGASLTKRLNC
jgi:hypothetical protein